MNNKQTLRDRIKQPEVDIGEIHQHHYTELLEENLEYVQEKTEKDPDYFKKRSKFQKPKYMFIGCSDSRVPPEELVRVEPGEIFNHRNIANQVLSTDINCMSTIQYAVEQLKVEHIVVMGHTHCGGIRAAVKCDHLGLIDQWLQNIRDIAFLHKDELGKKENEEEFLKKLTEFNVREQTLNLCKTPFVQKAWEEGRKLIIHGWVCDIETGLIKDLNITTSEWKKIENYYKYHFNAKF